LWRRREALTLKAAAGKIWIHGSTLARIERGESMHGATLTTVLVWLMGREEPSANEAFTFEAEDAAAGEDQIAERNAALAGECDETLNEEEAPAPGAAIEDQPEEAKELSLHAVDQDASLCGVRQEWGGGGAHGAAGSGAEGAG
jgi:hypothetical protein